MPKPKRPNVAMIQNLLNQLSYDEFILLLAVLADQHPLGEIKRVQDLPGGKRCVIFVKSYPSIDEVLRVVEAIDSVN